MTSVPSARLVRFVQLAALWAFAVSQPVFSFLEGNPEFLILRDAMPIETIGFSLVLAFGPPLAAVAYSEVARLASQWVGDMLFLAALAAFSVPLAFQIVKPLEPSRSLVFLLVLMLCAIVVASYVRWRAVRLFLGFSIVLPIIGLASFIHSIPAPIEEAHAAPAGIASRHPVIVVVLDELPVTSLMTRGGDIDSVRYPSFGRLAAGATWYPNATTVHNWTYQAVPAMLTGKMPRRDALPTLNDHPDNLFTLLGGSYNLFVHDDTSRLCPTNYCPETHDPLLDRLDHLFGDIVPPYVVKVFPRSVFEFSGEVAADRIFQRASKSTVRGFEQFYGEFNRDELPESLHLVHLMLPHFPWRYFPSGRMYGFTANDNSWRTWQDDSWVVRQSFQRHILQLQYTDTLLGRLFDRLRKLGLYDRALLVVVADHGASFRPGASLRSVSDENIADIASVPMFVKYPGQARGAVDLRAAQTIDILPTIADVLGAQPRWRVDGSSLLASPPRSTEVVVAGRTGAFMRASLRSVKQQNEATVHRNAAWLGEGHDSLFRIGTNQQLLGKQVGKSRPASRTVRVHIEEDWRLTNVQESSAFVPAHISGVVDNGWINADTELAIVVNGRVRALTRCFLDGDVLRFRALVPESAFKNGFNQVEVYAIDAERGRLRLVRLGASRGSG